MSICSYVHSYNKYRSDRYKENIIYYYNIYIYYILLTYYYTDQNVTGVKSIKPLVHIAFMFLSPVTRKYNKLQVT